jgi:hypothetical protein
MPVKDQVVKVTGDRIEISRPTFNSLGMITYDEDLLKKVQSVTWSKSGKYLKSHKLKLTLHQLAIKHFYGDEVLEEAYKNKMVVDHIDNNSYDCTYENLALIPKDLNTAKGQTFDKERKQLLRMFAINITKDRDTDEFQISVLFNTPTTLLFKGENIKLSVIYLRYGKDFRTAFNDANTILTDLVNTGRLDFRYVHASNFMFRQAYEFELTEDEVNGVYIIREGQFYMLQGTGKAYGVKAGHIKELHQS